MTQAVSVPLAMPSTSARIHPLVAVLLVAAAIRLPLAFVPNVHMPDEIFQVLEPAWRLLGHESIISWEWRDGIRPWLLPTLMTAPVALGDWLAPGGMGAFVMPRIAAALISLSVVASAYLFGARTSQTHGIVAGFVAAIWFEFVFFAPHTLSEPIATAAILPAAYILTSNRPSRQQLVAAGALLGFVFIIRFHYAPVMMVLIAVTCWKRRNWLWPLASGGCAILIVGGLIDAACGATPFAWIVESIRHNIVLGRAATFGVEPATAYLSGIYLIWSIAAVPLLVAVAKGYRHAPILLWLASTNVAIHSAIGHKEYRFVFVSIAAIVILAAIGSVDWIIALRKIASLRRVALPLVLSAWFVTSACLAVAPNFRDQWSRGIAATTFTSELRNDPTVCGIATLEMPLFPTVVRDRSLDATPIYSIFLDDPLAIGGTAAAVDRMQASYNRIIARRDMAPAIPSAFSETTCSKLYGHPICIYARRGSCKAESAASFLVNDTLVRLGM